MILTKIRLNESDSNLHKCAIIENPLELELALTLGSLLEKKHLTNKKDLVIYNETI